MKYAIFSDIHSNLEAYEAVLAEIAGQKVDEYYCCGDIVGYGADPGACIQVTRELNPKIVAGNHDWGSVGLTDLSNFTENARAAVLWTKDKLSREDELYLKGLPVLYKNDFMLVHGALERPEEFEYIFDLSDAYKNFLVMRVENICFFGHTHAAGIFVKDKEDYVGYNPWSKVKVEKRKRYLVNVGSVGQPRDGDPRAAYCIYDRDSSAIELRRVKYDVETAQKKIVKAGLPGMLAERLSLGK